MCTSKPKITKAADPVVSPAAPPPEQTAQAPDTASSAKRQDINQKRKGISALRIDLNIPGAGGSGMSIPQ